MADQDVRKVNYPFSSEAEEASLMGAVVLDPPSLDEAIMGVLKNHRGDAIFVYDHEELVRCFARDMFEPNGESDPTALDQAFEWVSFNTIRALPYMGDRAPMILQRVDDECVDDVELSELTVFDGRCWIKP